MVFVFDCDRHSRVENLNQKELKTIKDRLFWGVRCGTPFCGGVNNAVLPKMADQSRPQKQPHSRNRFFVSAIFNGNTLAILFSHCH